MGGDKRAVDEFYRLWLAPGVGHCGGRNGATPSDPLGVLIEWVEEGIMPNTLPGKGPEGMTRDLCRFPRRPSYSGSGDIDKAESWTCV
jgi:hypothetical protein